MTSLNHKALAAALFASLAMVGCGRDDGATTSTTTATDTSATAATSDPASTGAASGVVAGTDTTTTDPMGTSTAPGYGTMTGSATTLDFDTLDVNRDGMVSQGELPADRSGAFAQYDTDGNQSLSRSELDSMATAANDVDNDQ